MVCYHPIIAYDIGINKDTGSHVLKFIKKEQDVKNGQVYRDYFGNPHPDVERLLLPCRRCIGCTTDRAKEWATRLVCELEYHEKACFITLTYNDEHVPMSCYPDPNGEMRPSMTLKKEHLQKFMKRLRKRYEPQKIRFFACGEYGSKYKRPHYHAILYGVDFSEDRYVHEITSNGDVLYRSPTLEKLWTNPITRESLGFSTIGDVTYFSCGYVARYCTKKKYGRRNMYYQTFRIQPEFNLMSRRPGIGKQYYDDNLEKIYDKQEIFISTLKGGLKVRPPEYFNRLYDIDYPEESSELKETRKEMAKIAMERKLDSSGYENVFQLLEAEEAYALERADAKRRSIE